MKRILCVLLCAAMMAICVSCGNDLSEDIVGVWENDVAWVFTFSDDGTWSFAMRDENGQPYTDNSGEYTIKGDVLTMTLEGNDFNECNASIDGDEMIWSFDDSATADQVLRRVV